MNAQLSGCREFWSSRMRRSVLICVTASLSTNLSVALARAATLTYSDGVCEHRVAYDAKKVDGRQLKASFDYLAGAESSVGLPPSFATPDEIAAIDGPEYQRRCAAHRQRLAAPDLIALPGLDGLRRREVEDLDTACARTEASLAAIKGDVAPARAHAPACTRYTDLLALPASKLKAQWNDLVADLCQASTDRGLCAGALQRRGEGPGSETRRRLAVLTRWSECATKPERAVDGEKQKLLQGLAKRYKAKVTTCAR